MKEILFLAIICGTANAFEWNNIDHVALNVDNIIPRNLLPTPAFQNRIVNGEEVDPHSAPWQVGLMIKMKNSARLAFCGGSMISANYVLTAAHCVEFAEWIEVVLGAHEIKSNEASQVRMNSTEFMHHEKWSRITLLNDIAVIKLPEAVQANEYIQPIGLPAKSGDHDLDGHIVAVTGWGKDTDEATEISKVLRGITVPTMPNVACNNYFFGYIQDSHVCTDSWAGSIGSGMSTCSGDSGGPLVHAVDETTVEQVGIVSFGFAMSCELGWPAAYTRVSSHLDWIEDNTDVIIPA